MQIAESARCRKVVCEKTHVVRRGIQQKTTALEAELSAASRNKSYGQDLVLKN